MRKIIEDLEYQISVAYKDFDLAIFHRQYGVASQHLRLAEEYEAVLAKVKERAESL